MLWPSVIDVAVESEVKVILTGAGLSPKEVPDINCQFINKQDQVNIKSDSIPNLLYMECQFDGSKAEFLHPSVFDSNRVSTWVYY